MLIDTQRVEPSGLSFPLLRHRFADMGPEIPKDRHLPRIGQIVRHRHAGQLHDPAFDRVHQAEIARRPGEERAFGVA